MKLVYEEPVIEIRNYSVPPVLTGTSYEVTTDPNLEGGDEYPDIFG